MSADAEPGDAIVVDGLGRVGLGTPSPTKRLDVRGDVTATGGVNAASFVGNGEQLVIDDETLQEALNAKVASAGGTVQGDLEVTGRLFGDTVASRSGAEVTFDNGIAAPNVRSTNRMRDRMYPAEPIKVYDEIFEAFNAGCIEKMGSPIGFNATSYKDELWCGRHIIEFGGNTESDGNGALVTMPSGTETLWVRVLGDRWNTIQVTKRDDTEPQLLGLFSGGLRSASAYSPDGSTTDGGTASPATNGVTSPVTAHQWVPIPVNGATKVGLVAKAVTDYQFWLSGLAFSKNPWGHAVQSAQGYRWQLNGGDEPLWSSNDWEGDVQAGLFAGSCLTLHVPVVPNGKDKLIYLVEADLPENRRVAHTALKLEGQPIERFLTTYDNPFARFWNSRTFETYAAAFVPNELIEGQRFVKLTVDLTKQLRRGINFREIGSHDYDVPWP